MTNLIIILIENGFFFNIDSKLTVNNRYTYQAMYNNALHCFINRKFPVIFPCFNSPFWWNESP